MDNQKTKTSVQIRVRLTKEEPYWGPGTRMMMQGIAAHESVREACRANGISYSKGRKIIERAEQGCQMPLVMRKQGGSHGGTSSLTENCLKRMALFDELEQAIQTFAEQKYCELEKKYLP